ncbi:uncharacterized protein cubi_03105 [Cryptosporidium ubiquitum]|uniref:Lipoprotein n=1 Tax=Cryptosporidium ubiquitum TaxID=857276 RepID=A0A1J4MNG4_9CRYT|nr:uncharacterized protein cubi_03105 [Cryptosporidium ubiquitum]OII74995.1 hypothetical protein cubi_03105 [Cryptosporidium ubiquitum]
MYKLYFSLFFLFTFSFLLVGCYFNWENNYVKFAFEIFRDAKINFPFNSYISRHSFEIQIFEKHGETLFEEFRNETKQEDLVEKVEIVKNLQDSLEVILESEPIVTENRRKFSNNFGFPLNLNPRGFNLMMKIKYGRNSEPIKIIFMGRDLRNLFNIIIKECRIYLFSKDNKSNGYFYDSSPLFLPKNSSDYLHLMMEWSEETFRVSAVRPDNTQVALGSIVKTDSPLIASGSAFMGETLIPLQIEWNFTNKPINVRFYCLINYFEGRCKSNSIRILDTSNKRFLSLKADRGFLKVAFQFPPKNKLPVNLKMIGDKELAVTIQFFLDQMVVHVNSNSFKHFFLNEYQEGEWLNLDLVPISNLSLKYLIQTLKIACSTRIFGLKSTNSCLDSIKEGNSSTKDRNKDSAKGSCENDFLQNIARSGKILDRGYKLPKKKELKTFNLTEETEISDTSNSNNNFKLLMAIDEEIIGNILIKREYLDKFSLSSGNSVNSFNYTDSSHAPLGYWRLKAGFPKYIENLVSFLWKFKNRF